MAVLRGVRIPIQLPTFNSLGNIYKTEISGLYGSSIFNFLKNLHSFLVTAPFYIPISIAQGFHFLHIPVNTYFLIRKKIAVYIFF